MNSNKSCKYLLITGLFSALGCGTRPPGGQDAMELTRCPASPPAVHATRVVRAGSYPIELQLPADSIRSEEFADELERGQAWMGNGGLVVTYASTKDPPKLRERTRSDRNVVQCSEEIDGRLAVVHMLYSEATTAPGQRVLAIWRLGEGQTLVVSAFHPDPDRRGDLLNIIRSVRFGP